MITFIFLGFVALFLVAGVFIAINAKRGRSGEAHRPMPRRDTPDIGRATSEKD